jgi:hypothetical protein
LDIVRPGCWTLDFGETLKLRLCLLSSDGMCTKFVPFRLERAPSAFSWVSERPASWKSRSSLFPLELFWAGLNGSFLLLIYGKLATPVPAVDLLYLFKSDRLIILVPFVKESSSWLSLECRFWECANDWPDGASPFEEVWTKSWPPATLKLKLL